MRSLLFFLIGPKYKTVWSISPSSLCPMAGAIGLNRGFLERFLIHLASCWMAGKERVVGAAHLPPTAVFFPICSSRFLLVVCSNRSWLGNFKSNSVQHLIHGLETQINVDLDGFDPDLPDSNSVHCKRLLRGLSCVWAGGAPLLAFHAGRVVHSLAASATRHTMRDVDSAERGRLTVLPLRNQSGVLLVLTIVIWIIVAWKAWRIWKHEARHRDTPLLQMQLLVHKC